MNPRGFLAPINGLQCPAYLGTSADWATRELQHMVKIRLTRGGAKKRPFYHIIVTDSRSARDGRNIERLGFYNPMAPEGQERLRIDRERLTHWQKQGATLSPTAKRLVKEMGA